MLIEEIKPEKAVIFAGDAVHAEIEIRRHTQRGQHVPGRGDEQEDQDCAERAQFSPCIARKKLTGNGQINDHAAYRHYQRE